MTSRLPMPILKRRTTQGDQRGSSLLELLIYVSIVGLVLTAAVMFAAEFVASQAKGAAQIEAARNSQFAVERMAVQVREATGIDSAGSTFGGTSSVLKLCTDSSCTSSLETVFNLSGGVLYETLGTASAVALTSGRVTVSEFTVDDLSTGSKTKEVRLHVKTDYANPTSLIEYTATSTVETTAKVNKDDGFGT